MCDYNVGKNYEYTLEEFIVENEFESLYMEINL